MVSSTVPPPHLHTPRRAVRLFCINITHKYVSGCMLSIRLQNCNVFTIFFHSLCLQQSPAWVKFSLEPCSFLTRKFVTIAGMTTRIRDLYTHLFIYGKNTSKLGIGENNPYTITSITRRCPYGHLSQGPCMPFGRVQLILLECPHCNERRSPCGLRPKRPSGTFGSLFLTNCS